VGINNNSESTDDIDLSCFPFFKSLTKEECDILNFEKKCIASQRGTIVYEEGCRLSGFYFITRGIVKIYKTGIDGKEQIIKFANKGDIFGYRSLLSEETACSTSKVIEDAILYHIPYKILLNLVEANPLFSLDILRIACDELKEANECITYFGLKTVRERLAEVLLLLHKNFKLDTDQRIQISLTREELANTVGTATEVIIRFLSEFKREKLIDLKGRKIKILNLNELKKVAKLTD